MLRPDGTGPLNSSWVTSMEKRSIYGLSAVSWVRSPMVMPYSQASPRSTSFSAFKRSSASSPRTSRSFSIRTHVSSASSSPPSRPQRRSSAATWARWPQRPSSASKACSCSTQLSVSRQWTPWLSPGSTSLESQKLNRSSNRIGHSRPKELLKWKPISIPICRRRTIVGVAVSQANRVRPCAQTRTRIRSTRQQALAIRSVPCLKWVKSRQAWRICH